MYSSSHKYNLFVYYIPTYKIYSYSQMSVSGSSSDKKTTTNAVFIFRRDLRVEDNTALLSCLETHEKVYPIFVFSPEQIKPNEYRSEKAVQFMIESLFDLRESINFQCYYGDILQILNKMKTKLKTFDVFLNRDYSPYSVQRDTKIFKWCVKHGLGMYVADDILLNDFRDGVFKVESDADLKWTAEKSDKIYQKFTPYYNIVIRQAKTIREPIMDENMMKWIRTKTNVNITTSETIQLEHAYYKFCTPSVKIAMNGGRKTGFPAFRKRLISGEFSDYTKKHNDLTYRTTTLSPYLKFGCISVREVFAMVKSKYGIHHDIIRQLVWRDFYYRIIFAFPHVLGGQIGKKNEALKEKYDEIEWERNKSWLEAWKWGNTGFPVVDACMRELVETGYMHNRGRLIVSSFLVKTMGIDWREGEKWFASRLIDHDNAANNQNWQWTAGSGADSQPYFRIFNPWLQSEKFDPQTEYIKKWVPELADVEPKVIHRWYKMGDKDIYMLPILDYTKQKGIVLDMYKDGLKN
jgi:deoxyribodipyrimidine photo-lyase